MKTSGKLLLLFTAVIGVDAAAVRAWWGHHPVVAAVVSLTWAGVVGLGSLVAKALKKPADKRLEQFGDAADRALARKLSRYGRRYREHVSYKSRFMNITGLATPGVANPALDEVFVDVGLEYRLPDRVTKSVVPRPFDPSTRRFSVWQELENQQPAILVLLGAPGSGKTTLLRHVAGQLADKSPKHWRRPVPVLLELRDHAILIAGESRPSLAEVIRASLMEAVLREPAGWWEKRLAQGACVVLLDGLDEVADSSHRDIISRWIAVQISANYKCDFVVTSRPHGYNTTKPIPGAKVLETQPFTEEQVQRFLRSWYRVDERVSTRREGLDVDRLADEKAADLLQRLADNPNLDELKANPLLLTMIANVHRYRGALPGGRAELYKEVCEVMLWRRAEAKNIGSALSGTIKSTVLARLALEMMSEEQRDIRHGKAVKSVTKILERVQGSVDARDFLADIAASGLIVEREHDLLAFAHLTFQEYLAATQISSASLLAKKVNEPWWRETTLLYVARGGDADPIVRACLASRTIHSLSLAFSCTEDGAALAPELRTELAQVIDDAFSGGGPKDHRWMVAGVLAQRHLRSSVKTSNGTRVYQPIPSNLYRLFQMDADHSIPDGNLGPGPRATTPVTGVWLTDATKFCSWLNALISGATFRLPTVDEMREVAASSAFASWCSDADDVGQYIHFGDDDIVSVSKSEFEQALARDIAECEVLEALGTQRRQWCINELLGDIVEALRALHSWPPKPGERLLGLELDMEKPSARDRESIRAIAAAMSDITQLAHHSIPNRDIAQIIQKQVVQQSTASAVGDGEIGLLVDHVGYLAERVQAFYAWSGGQIAQICERYPVITRIIEATDSLALRDAVTYALGANKNQSVLFAKRWISWLIPDLALQSYSFPPATFKAELRAAMTDAEARTLRLNAMAEASLAQQRDERPVAEVSCDFAIGITGIQKRSKQPENLEHLILARGQD